MISERTKAGLEAARARGRMGGHPWSLTPTQILGLAQAMKDQTTKPGELTEARKRALASGKKGK